MTDTLAGRSSGPTMNMVTVQWPPTKVEAAAIWRRFLTSLRTLALCLVTALSASLEPTQGWRIRTHAPHHTRPALARRSTLYTASAHWRYPVHITDVITASSLKDEQSLHLRRFARLSRKQPTPICPACNSHDKSGEGHSQPNHRSNPKHN